MEEALEIHRRVSDAVEQADCLNDLAWLLYADKQLDASEEAASRAIALLPEPEKGGHFLVCQCHRILGKVYLSKGEREKAIGHFQTALEIASSSDWHNELVGINCSLAKFFSKEGKFDDANDHVRRAKSHAVNNTYSMGFTMELQAKLWYEQRRLEEAKSEALRAAEVYERLGAAKDVEDCGKLLLDIQKELNNLFTSGESDSDGELLETVLLLICINLEPELRELNGRICGAATSNGSFHKSPRPHPLTPSLVVLFPFQEPPFFSLSKNPHASHPAFIGRLLVIHPHLTLFVLPCHARSAFAHFVDHM